MNSRFALPLLLVVLLGAGAWVLLGNPSPQDPQNDSANQVEANQELEGGTLNSDGLQNSNGQDPERTNMEAEPSSVQDSLSNNQAPRNLASFYGVVQDDRGMALADVTIHAFGLSGWAASWDGDESRLAAHWETTTNADGFFELPQAPRDRLRFILEFQHAEFAAETLNNLSANIGRGHDLGVITLGAGFSIKGTVFDDQGNPLAGARITPFPDTELFRISSRNQPKRPLLEAVVSDASGSFEFSGLPQRAVRLRAEADGFFEGWSSSVSGKHGDELKGIEVQLNRATQSFGIVMDDKRGPVAGARVVAAASSAGFTGRKSESVETTTDADGRFSLALPDDTEELRLTVGAQGFWVTEYRHGENPLNSPIEISLTPIAPLTGVVVDESGRGVAGAEVRLVENRQGKINPRDMVANVKTVADANGTFTLIPNLRSAWGGRFSVYAWDDTHAVGNSEMFRLRSAARFKAPDLRILVGQGFRASGTVLGPEGKPLNRARVHLRSLRKARQTAFGPAIGAQRGGDIFGHTESAADGSFSFDGLASGDYRIEAYHQGLSPAMSEAFSLIDQDFETDLRLQAAASIAGHVEGPIQAFRGLSVSAQAAGLDPIDVRVDSQGEFRFDEVMPGTWNLQLRDADQEAASAGMVFGNAQPLAQITDLAVRAGETTSTTLTINLAGRGEIHGTVKVNDQYAADYMVFTVPNSGGGRQSNSLFSGSKSGQQMRVTSCDYTGKFQIPALASGNYWVVLCKPGTFPDGLGFGSQNTEMPAGLQTQSIRIGDGNDQEVNFDVLIGSLKLTVANPGEGNAARTRIIPDPADGRRSQSFYLRRRGHEIQDIASGGYLLQIRDGRDWISTRLNVSPGGTTDVSVTLPLQKTKKSTSK